MNYEVFLKFHQDQNGFYGLCPKESVGTFDAFWGPDGVFHDVFEHFFEGKHSYFSDQYQHTIYGEMAASGAALAYASIGINNFKYRTRPGYGLTARDYTADTRSYLESWLYDEYEDYPVNPKLCAVPGQKEPEDPTFRYWLNVYMNWYEARVEKYPKLKKLKKSHIRNCYIWGFKYVSALVADKEQAYDTFDKFLDTWYQITGNRGVLEEGQGAYIADESAYALSGFRFRVTSSPTLQIEQVAVDEIGQEFSLDLLETY